MHIASTLTTRHILIVGSLVALFLGLLEIGSRVAFTSAQSNPRNVIEAKVAALSVKSRTGESLSDHEARFRVALSNSDFKEAERIAAYALAHDRQGYWSSSPLSDFMVGIVDYNDPAVERRLDAWVQQSTGNPLPLLIRAQYEYAIGWRIRGGAAYSDINPTDLSIYVAYMKKGLVDINRAAQLAKQLPAYAYYLKYRLLQAGGTADERQLTFQNAIQRYPDYYPIYSLALSDHQPKWGGSVHEMYDFVDRHVSKTSQYSPLRVLYLDLYADLLNVAWMACGTSEIQGSDKSVCISSLMARLSSSDLEENVRRSFRLYDHTDRYQFGQAIQNPIQAIMKIPYAGAYGVAVLQMAANAMRSDTRLFDDRPSRNDFVIDELVASSWFQVGNYENAIKKENEALDDLQHTIFPSGEAKDIAVAGIYLQIAIAKGRLHEYVDQAAYQQASTALGGRNGYEHTTCFVFYKIAAPDEVIPACDKAVAANGDDVETYYWRAQFYFDRKQGADALSDLERVASSRDTLRASSAIEMSMVYFDQKNEAAVLEILDKYSYLYDDKVTARDDVAVAYNNRCYAHMQLGAFRKALEDCRASLKFGNLPDAYKKTEELERRLTNVPI